MFPMRTTWPGIQKMAPPAGAQFQSNLMWCDTSSIIVITRSVLFSLKCTRNRLAAGLCVSAALDPLAVLGGGIGPPVGGEKGGKGKPPPFPKFWVRYWARCKLFYSCMQSRVGRNVQFCVHWLEQEGWLSPTERASVAAISLKHILATSGESRRYVVAFTRFAGRGIWLRQESLRNILASPDYASGTIALNVTWMERGFNACQTHRSIVPIYLQPFPSNSIRKFKSFFSHLAHFFAHFGFAWIRPWDNRGKCHTVGKRIQCL